MGVVALGISIRPRDDSRMVGNPEIMAKVLVNALTVHVKYWEELVRFADKPGVDQDFC